MNDNNELQSKIHQPLIHETDFNWTDLLLIDTFGFKPHLSGVPTKGRLCWRRSAYTGLMASHHPALVGTFLYFLAETQLLQFYEFQIFIE